MNKAAFARIAGVAVIGISASAALGSPTQAAGTDDSTRGTCTGPSNVRLIVTDGGNDRLNVKAQITDRQRGEQIQYVIADNGNKVKTGNKDTGRKGKTTIVATIQNVGGRDNIVFTSTNTETVEVCTASLIFRD